MSRPPKYLKGETLSPIEAFGELLANRPVFHRHKLQTPGWTLSWQINMLIVDAKKGWIVAAYGNPEHKDFRP